MSLREIGVGPFKGNLVEDYDGDNEHKKGTVFVPALGIRLNSRTGEAMPGTVVYGAAGSDFERNQMRARMQQLEEQLAEAQAGTVDEDQLKAVDEELKKRDEAARAASDAHKKEIEALKAEQKAALDELNREHKEALAKVSSGGGQQQK